MLIAQMDILDGQASRNDYISKPNLIEIITCITEKEDISDTQ
jgi:hypothetical protein